MLHALRAWASRLHRRLIGDVALGLGILLVAIVLFISWDTILPLPLTLMFDATLLVSLALVVRRYWTEPFGPMFLYDVIRTARRSKLILHRCLYLICLWIILYLVYSVWFPGMSLNSMFDDILLDPKELPRFAQSFFISFFLLQFAAVLVATPAYIAGTIATEKANRTLDFMLTTHLTSREIVLGILAARVGNLLLLLLAGLPVLGLLQFLGGVDSNLIFASFFALVVTMLSLSGVSILLSVHARTPLGAVLGSYAFTILYVYFFLIQVVPLRSSSSMKSEHAEVYLIWTWLTVYALIHGGVAVVCTFFAVLHLRRAASRAKAVVQDLPRARPRVRGRTRPRSFVKPRITDTLTSEDALHADEEPGPLLPTLRRRLPPVRDDALYWKELDVEQGVLQEQKKYVLIFGLGIVFLVFGLVLLIGAASNDAKLPQFSNSLVRSLGTFFSAFLLLGIALGAANRISRERERATLDSLLTIPAERTEILFAKWLASIWLFRWPAIVVAVIWILGMFSLGLNVLALLLLLLAAAVYVALLASLGLWFSSICGSSMRATMVTAVVSILVIVGPGVLWKIISNSFGIPTRSFWVLVLDQGLSPIENLWVLSFSYDEVPWLRVLAGLAGLSVHALAALALWTATRARFQAEKGPAPLSQPPVAFPGE